MRKPIAGEIWKHRNNMILCHIDHVGLTDEQVKRIFNLFNIKCSRTDVGSLRVYDTNGKHFHDQEWDLIEFIGNINDPTKVPEDDWSDE